MKDKELKKLLKGVSSGKIKTEKAFQVFKDSFYNDLGFAKVDLHRPKRKGFPEVIFCPGKTTKQIQKIAKELYKSGESLMATKADKKVFKAIKEAIKEAEYNEIARVVFAKKEKSKPKGDVLILTAGTSDIPIAEESAVTAEIMGSKVERIYDVGIAGLHRLLDFKDKLLKAKVIVVVAGMEGALPSLVAGLVNCPVIGVPTSIGYGTSFQGITPLFSMLNSCAEGLAVVNIDNGFGAGYIASLINLGASRR
ncbi:MAG: nickel pincer cofactor biosynthesis protein LarB [Actinomycetia bacterium]|nr:nickel pincer cofactor biosynthesis protein LarB [Actinomycetes bacterium]